MLALSLVLAGCAGDTSSRPPATAAPTTSALATTPAQPADQCGAPTTPAQSFWLPVPEGARLQAAMVGTGTDTAVFVHASGNRGLCGFWPYADWLAKVRGVRSVLVNQCGYGASQCPAGEEYGQWLAATKAAVTWAREHGARQVTVVGASVGGIVALQAGASIRPRVDAVVNLSGELRWKGPGLAGSRPAPPGAGAVRRRSRRRLCQRGHDAPALSGHAGPLQAACGAGRGRGPWLGAARRHARFRLVAAGGDRGGMDSGSPPLTRRTLVSPSPEVAPYPQASAGYATLGVQFQSPVGALAERLAQLLAGDEPKLGGGRVAQP
jgi:pimeloyl-ACP methyl ester carboxylesterase